MRKNTLKKIFSYLGHQKLLFFLSLVFSAVTVISSLTIPILTGQAVDCLTRSGEVDISALIMVLVRIAAIVLLSTLAQWLMNLCNNRLVYDTVKRMREDAERKLHRLPLSFIDSHPQGDLVSRITADAELFSDGLLMGLTQLFSGVLTVIGVLIFLFRENAGLAAVVAVLTPLSLLTARFIASKSYVSFGRQAKTRGEETALMEEMTNSLQILKANGREAEVMARFQEQNERLERDSLKAVFASSLTNPSTRFINNLVYASVAVFGALIAVGNPHFTAGMLTAFLVYAYQYTKPFNEISGVVTELQNSFACADRVFSLLAETEEEDTASEEIPQEVGEVAFSHVDFSYVPEKPLITDFTLDVEKASRIAIVGPTGAGKSTLINLLMRFYDVDRGEIRFSGIPVKKLHRQSLRRCFGMVLQETWLKTATIRENIAFGKPDASLEEIITAAKKAHADSFIRRLSKGYDTVLQEGGTGLSEGQRQLLCIARVFLVLPDLLILDEATSSIDLRTEQKIQDAFAALMQGRTSFVVAHRLSTIQSADVILYLEDGHVKEQGTHEELLQKNGAYASMYHSQWKNLR